MSYKEKRFIPVFGMFLIIIYAAINVVSGDTNEIKQPLPQSLTDLAAVKVIEISDANGNTILKGSFVESGNDLNEVEHTAVLTGNGSSLRGKASIEISKKKNGFTEKELEVEMYDLAARAVFKVTVDGREVASFTTDHTGKAELELSNEHTK